MKSRRIVNWSHCLFILFTLSIALTGCSRTARSLSLNQPKAREACTEFLTAWKNGKRVGDLKPKIIGRDSDWETGKKLESFEILKDERSDGTNLHLTVRRTLKDGERDSAGGRLRRGNVSRGDGVSFR